MAEQQKKPVVGPDTPRVVHSAQDIPLTNPLGVQSTYANDVGVAFTRTDVRLLFAEVGPGLSRGDDPNEVGEKVLKANVVLPLEQAAGLAQWLIGALQQHRKDIEAAVANALKSQKS